MDAESGNELAPLLEGKISRKVCGPILGVCGLTKWVGDMEEV